MTDHITQLIPERDDDPNIQRDKLIKAAIEAEQAKIDHKLNLKEIARIRKREMHAATNLAIYGSESKVEAAKVEAANNAHKRREALQEAKAKSPVVFANTTDIVAGTTKYDITKLLTKLNIELDVRFTKTDTYNLLATLLTCNEKQLVALRDHPKVPIAIRTVIVRLLKDNDVGNIENIEKLWDRVFGKNNMADINPPTGYAGLIPNTPISREAYVLIRETFIGKDDYHAS